MPNQKLIFKVRQQYCFGWTSIVVSACRGPAVKYGIKFPKEVCHSVGIANVSSMNRLNFRPFKIHSCLNSVTQRGPA